LTVRHLITITDHGDPSVLNMHLIRRKQIPFVSKHQQLGLIIGRRLAELFWYSSLQNREPVGLEMAIRLPRPLKGQT
jgi:hypothetical protein